MSKHELTVPATVRTGVALALALCASAAFACDASVLAGDWRGAYVRGGAAQVITLHVNAASPAFTASYSVPDLGVHAAKADIFECENDVVRLKAVYGLFTLHLDTAGQELDRVESTLRADEVPADSIAEALEYTRAMFEAVRDSSQWSQLQRLTEASREKPWFSTVAAPASMEDLAGWRPIYAFDPAETLRRIAMPTLAIYGEADTIVPPHKNAALLQSLLGQRGAAVKVAVIPNAGHSLETFGTLKGDEWKWPDSHWVFPRKAPELLQIVREWLAP